MKINKAFKTKRFNDPKVEVEKGKRKLPDETTEPQHNAHREATTGWQPDLPHNDSALLFQQKEMSKRLTNKNNKDAARIKDLMDETYTHRRKLINDGADVFTIKEEYAALFCIEELENEFTRLTGVNMDATFLKKFPSMATRLVAYANSSLMYSVVEGVMLLEVNELCQAMCMLFECYCALNFQYPKSKVNGGIVGTLSFIQHCLFGIKDGEKVLGCVESWLQWFSNSAISCSIITCELIWFVLVDVYILQKKNYLFCFVLYIESLNNLDQT